MIKHFWHSVQKSFFENISTNHLIYNTCWEDPRIDRQLLNFNPESKVVCITSAGDNILDYLLDDPAEIHAVDVNPRQNALLELKLVLLQQTDHEALFRFFGEGKYRGETTFYRHFLRPHLSEKARFLWDQDIKVFSPLQSKGGFYYHGTTGLFAWFMQQYLRHRGLMDSVNRLLQAESLREQAINFQIIERTLWNNGLLKFLNSHFTMSLLGVPKEQVRLINDSYRDGLAGFLKQQLNHVFTKLPIADNYFWHVYMKGNYSESCSPNYLKDSNFDDLREQSKKVNQYQGTLTQFLRDNPGEYTHFILLDHQDWLAWNHPEALEEEWNLILQNAAPGAQILMRSAGLDIDWLPEQVWKQTEFYPEQANRLHHFDRVGTYASTHHGAILN